MQRLSAITHAGFGLFRVRSPLLTESRLFSFPVGTEMFHFPTFPPTTLCVQVEVAGHYSGFFRGFPIRRSTDQSSFTSSPWLIAGYNVLHRLLMPRHPPIALSSLLFHYKDARVHCAVLKLPTTPPHARRRAYHPSTDEQRFTRQGQSVKETSPPGAVAGTRRPVPSGPNSVLELPQASGTRRSHPTRRRTSRCTSTRARKKSMFHP